MPHSSGGGSHSGGSHGSSHHSSSGGSSQRSFNRISKNKFNGANRYVYYRNGAPEFIYSNYDLTSDNRGKGLISLAVYAIMIIFALSFIPAASHFPKKLDISKYNCSISITDSAGVIDDEDALMDSLIAFQDKTGITPAVITLNNEDWQNNYTSLENYAYELYVKTYDDEMHWLIVYSEPKNPDPSFNDWFWEGMQGNDTDKILTYKETDLFNKEMQKGLTDKSISVDEAIRRSIDTLTPLAMKKYISFRAAVYPLFFVVFILFMAIKTSNFHPVKGKYYNNAVLCPETFVDQEKCEYCGGIYVVGMGTTCPNCGAALPIKGNNEIN